MDEREGRSQSVEPAVGFAGRPRGEGAALSRIGVSRSVGRKRGAPPANPQNSINPRRPVGPRPYKQSEAVEEGDVG